MRVNNITMGEWREYIKGINKDVPTLFCKHCGEFDEFMEFFTKEFKAPSNRFCKVDYDASKEITEDNNTRYECYTCGEETWTMDKAVILTHILLHLQKNWDWSDTDIIPENFNPEILKYITTMRI